MSMGASVLIVKFYRRPVSTICGHSFCKSCLASAIGYKQECPTCRATCSASLGVNIALAEILQERFPEDCARRAREAAEEAAENAALAAIVGSRASTTESQFLPVVEVVREVCDTLIPGSVLSIPLEPTFWPAIQFSRESGSNRLCVLGGDGWGLVVSVVGEREGRLYAKGLHRCELLGGVEMNERGRCLIGRVSPMHDSALNPATTERAVDLLLQMKESLDRQFALMGEIGKNVFVTALEERVTIGAMERTYLLSPDLQAIRISLCSYSRFESLSFVLLSMVAMDAKRTAIGLRDTVARLETVRAGLQKPRSLQGRREGKEVLRLDTKWSAILFLLLAVLVMYLKGTGVFDARSRGYYHN